MTRTIRLVASPKRLPGPCVAKASQRPLRSSQSEGGPFLYLDWEALAPGDRDSLQAAQGRPWALPVLGSEATKRVLDDYCALTEEIGLANGRASIWWYTWSSSRDRYNSHILEAMELLARLRVSREVLPDGLVFLCRDPHLAAAVRAALAGDGLRVRSGIIAHLRWGWRRVERWVRPWITAAKVVYRAACDRMALRGRPCFATASQRPPASSNGRRPHVVLVTPLRNRDVAQALPLQTYFGRLPAWLRERDVEVSLFGGLFEPAQRPPSAHRPEIPVALLPEWLRSWEWLRAYAVGFGARIRVPRSGALGDAAFRALVAADIHHNRGIAVVYGLLMEYALSRFLRAEAPDAVVHVCENNPWERACARAASSLAPQPERIGYLHTSVVLSHTKILYTDHDRLVRPQPHRLVCVGEQPRAILIRYGGHRPEETVAGCAWRFEYLRSLPPFRRTTRRPRRILVALEGLPSMVHLLRFMHEALAGQTEVTARLRAHPLEFPLESLLQQAALSLAGHPTLSATPHRHLLDDLREADVVVYKGSTTALEAGYLGLPLIHVQTPNLLTDDPLFEVEDLKRVVSRPDELVPAVEELVGLSPEAFSRAHASFRRYVETYLATPSEETARGFLPTAWKGRAP